MLKKIMLILTIILTTITYITAEPESYYNKKFCDSVGGKTETKHYYTYAKNKTGYIKIDCETDFFVYEGGKDKRSSLDSVQQALFFTFITKKIPVVVIYNTDNKNGKYEYRIKKACEKATIKYISKTIK